MDARQAIEEVHAIYVRAVDDRRLEGLRVVFDELTVFTMNDGEMAVGVDDAIARLGRRLHAAPRHRHLTTNVSITVHGDRARSHSDWYLMYPGAHGWYAQSAGTYDDDLRHTEDRWMFVSRTIALAPR
jgi:3-phenylpropionate/cinnamic acid dioxygenase small subunit